MSIKTCQFSILAIVFGLLCAIIGPGFTAEYAYQGPETKIPTLCWPLRGTMTSRRVLRSFGADWTWRDCGGFYKKHVGVDLAADVGEEVYAVYDGVVKVIYTASLSHNWGKGIVVEHPGFTSLYLHVIPLVEQGQWVRKGQKIAKIARIDTLTHLHFGIRCAPYSEIAKRGALPQKHGQSDWQDGKFTGCLTDPLFPEKFINPLSLSFEYITRSSLSVPQHGQISELLINGSFSQGSTGWSVYGDFWVGTSLPNCRTCPGYAAGGVNPMGKPTNNAVGWMYQTVTIPSGTSTATLVFWYNITSEEPTAVPHDILNVTIQDSSGHYLATVAVLSNADKTTLGDYRPITFDLTPYRGRTIRIVFSATTDGGAYTVFRIDDVDILIN